MTTTYTYDSNGLRTSKTTGDDVTEYTYLGSSLVYQVTNKGQSDEESLYFYYDDTGLAAFYYESAQYPSDNGIYHYVKDIQGNIWGLIDSNGELIARDHYSAYGEYWSKWYVEEGPTSVLQRNNRVRNANPFHYRGYYYDEETDLYYCQSRYYDPDVGRWLNADNTEVLTFDYENHTQYNLFVYCFNNPVNMIDDGGYWPKWLTGALNVVGGAVQMVAGAALGATLGWTGVGVVAAGFLVANGAATVTQGVGQIVNDVANSNIVREDNIMRTGVQSIGKAIAGDTGAKVAGDIYDIAVITTIFFASTVSIANSMPKIIKSKLFSANNGYGIKIGKHIEVFYRNPNAAGGPGGTIFNYNGPLGKLRLDWDPKYGFHFHPPGHK